MGKARYVLVAPVRLLHVLPQRELDAGRRGDEDQALRAGAVAELDDAALPANRVGGAVEQIDRSDPAGKLLVKGVRLGVDHIADAHHGTRWQRRFVHGAENGRVAMGINQAGRDVQALAVDHQRVWPRLDLAHISDHPDLAARHQDLGIGQDAIRAARPQRRMLNQDGLGLRQRPALLQRRARHPCLLQLAQLLLLLVPGFAGCLLLA